MMPWVAPQLEERARRPWRDVPAVNENGARPGARPLVATVRAAADAATTGGVGADERSRRIISGIRRASTNWPRRRRSCRRRRTRRA